jgi:glycosyltransferase involved in cell wall biosynthesis
VLVVKKVCLIHYSSAPGGIEVLMPSVIRHFPDIEFSVFVIRPPVRDDVNVYSQTVISIYYGSANNFIAAWKLWRFGIHNRKAVFHGFNIGPFFLLAIRLAGIRNTVYSIRGTLHYNGSLQKCVRRAMWNLAIASRYKFVANSEYSRDVFLRYIRQVRSKITVIYNPLHSDRISMQQKETAGSSLSVIYVGRLAEGKNLFRWIDTAILLRKSIKDALFFLYGDGPLKIPLNEYCRKTGADEYIQFMGYVKDISKAYHKADVLLFISEYESFGNVVVESILCGTPVIAADIPSMKEIFRNHPQFLVPSGSDMEKNIIERINKLSELRKVLPEVIEEFRARFSLEKHLAQLREVYNTFDT